MVFKDVLTKTRTMAAVEQVLDVFCVCVCYYYYLRSNRMLQIQS